MSASRMRIGIVGTGEMGRPVVDRLLAAGHDVAAYARRPEVRRSLADAGATLVDSVAALGPGRDVVLVYVYTDDQVREVALDEGLVTAMDPDATLVVHTTGSPATVQAIESAATAGGVDVVDAPGSGGPATVVAGSLTLFVGGADDAVARVRPVLDAYASTVTHVGPLGSGQAVKLLNNLLFGCHVELAVEATRLARSLGLDEGAFARTLHASSGASAALDLVAAMGSGEQLVATAGRFIHKDVVVAREVATGLGLSLGTIDAVATPLLERTRPAEPEDPTDE